MEPKQRQTQPALGGDSDGSTDGLDDAKLYVTCDNRTDELRLLGNGVVPATAELAFKTLLNEIQKATTTDSQLGQATVAPCCVRHSLPGRLEERSCVRYQGWLDHRIQSGSR
jgi:hypothetical protein